LEIIHTHFCKCIETRNPRKFYVKSWRERLVTTTKSIKEEADDTQLTYVMLPQVKIVGRRKAKPSEAGHIERLFSRLHNTIVSRQSFADVFPPSAISFSRRLPAICIKRLHKTK
jgi:hypothetical protein